MQLQFKSHTIQYLLRIHLADRPQNANRVAKGIKIMDDYGEKRAVMVTPVVLKGKKLKT